MDPPGEKKQTGCFYSCDILVLLVYRLQLLNCPKSWSAQNTESITLHSAFQVHKEGATAVVGCTWGVCMCGACGVLAAVLNLCLVQGGESLCGTHGWRHYHSLYAHFDSNHSASLTLASRADVVFVLRHLAWHTYTYLMEPLITSTITLNPVHLRGKDRNDNIRK